MYKVHTLIQSRVFVNAAGFGLALERLFTFHYDFRARQGAPQREHP